MAPSVQVVGVHSAAAHRQGDGEWPDARKHVPYLLIVCARVDVRT